MNLRGTAVSENCRTLQHCAIRVRNSWPCRNISSWVQRGIMYGRKRKLAMFTHLSTRRSVQLQSAPITIAVPDTLRRVGLSGIRPRRSGRDHSARFRKSLDSESLVCEGSFLRDLQASWTEFFIRCCLLSKSTANGGKWYFRTYRRIVRSNNNICALRNRNRPQVVEVKYHG